MPPLIYSDGAFAESAEINAADHGVLFGAGFFESFRTRNGVPVRLDAHLARLRAGCDRIGIRIPDTHLTSGVDEERWIPVLRRLADSAGLGDAVFRLTLTAGTFPGLPGAGDYAAPREWIVCRPLPPAAPAEGVSLHTLATVRDAGEWRPRPKSLNYLNSLLAARELAPKRRHPADEGLLLDAAGRVSEGVYMNLFWRSGDTVFTPHEDTGLLPGIGRARLIAALRNAGVAVKEVASGPESLLEANAVMLVSSVRGVVPVARLLGVTGEILREFPDAPAATAGIAASFDA